MLFIVVFVCVFTALFIVLLCFMVAYCRVYCVIIVFFIFLLLLVPFWMILWTDVESFGIVFGTFFLIIGLWQIIYNNELNYLLLIIIIFKGFAELVILG